MNMSTLARYESCVPVGPVVSRLFVPFWLADMQTTFEQFVILALLSSCHVG